MRNIPLPLRYAALAALLLLAAIYLWWRTAPGRMEDGCNLQQRPCSSPVAGGGRATLSIEPRPLEYGRPWRLTVTLEDAKADAVELDLAGLDAPTGYSRTALAAVKEHRYEGEAVVPLCSFEPIEWQATVSLKSGDLRRNANFVFSSDPAAVAKTAPRAELAAAPRGGSSALHGAGGTFGMDQVRGFATVLFFGYTAAPATCPQPLAVIDAALSKLSADERAKVRVVMVALDAEGDAPEKLQPKLQAKNPNYRVATGAGADLIGTARLYGAAYQPRTPGPDGKPRIDHTAVYSVLDAGGGLVSQIAEQDPERLAGELRKVLGAGATKPISPRQ